MVKEDTVDADLLLIDVAATDEEMQSPLRKRRKFSSSISETSYKRCRILDQIEYKSPLIHMGKINFGNSAPANLDESVVVIHEQINSTPLRGPASPRSENEQPASQDDSVIILSENEEESTNKSSKINRRKSIKIPVVRKNASRLSSMSLRSRVRANTAAKKTPLRKKKQRLITRLQSILIDSEDENTSSNKDLSKSESQTGIIGIDKTDVNVPNATEKSKKDVDNSSHSSGLVTELASPSSVTLDDVSVVWMATEGLCTAAEQLQALNTAARLSKSKKCPVLCTDRKGELTSSHSNIVNSQSAVRSSKRKRKRKKTRRDSFVRNGSSCPPKKQRRDVVKEKNCELNQPEASTIGRYYMKEKPVKVSGSLRDIVIDGTSIAISYTNGKFFSEDGLKLVIDYFKLRGHTVKAFVPQHKRSFKHKLLEKLYNEGTVVFTPSRRIGKRYISSYDDRYVLDYATMCDGIVVSLDQYRDLYEEKSEWKNTIENRLLVPTFVGNCVMFPEDPLGRTGPKLENFLRHY